MKMGNLNKRLGSDLYKFQLNERASKSIKSRLKRSKKNRYKMATGSGNKRSQYIFRKKIGTERNITLACNGKMIFISTWEKNETSGKLERLKQRSIFFNLCRWKTLWEFADDINTIRQRAESGETVSERIHLGGNLHLSVSSEFQRVDIRFWYVPEQEKDLRAGKPGISLYFAEWDVLNEVRKELNPLLELQSVESCLIQPVHQSMMSALHCPECHPPDRFYQSDNY